MGEGDAGFWQDDGKFFAAITRYDITGANFITHQRDQAYQHSITDLVAVLVIDLLEEIDVEEQADEISLVPEATVGLVFQALIEIAAVVGVGQAVLVTQFQRALLVDAVLDRDSNHRSQFLQEESVVVLIVTLRILAQQQLNADDFIAAFEWQQSGRLIIIFIIEVDEPVILGQDATTQLWALRDIRDQQFAGFNVDETQAGKLVLVTFGEKALDFMIAIDQAEADLIDAEVLLFFEQ